MCQQLDPMFNSICCAKNTLRASVLYRRSSIKDYRIHMVHMD